MNQMRQGYAPSNHNEIKSTYKIDNIKLCSMFDEFDDNFGMPSCRRKMKRTHFFLSENTQKN